MLKPGWKTTEFYASILAALGADIAALSGHLSPHWAAISTSLSVGFYAVSRGLAKVPTPIVPPVQPTTVVPPPTP